MEPKANNPNPTPKWVKETLVEDYADQQRGVGVQPNIRDLETIVQEDLRRYHAEEREGLHRNLITPKKRGCKSDPASELAKKMGGEMVRGRDIRRKVSAADLLTVRQRLMHGRIKFLMGVKPGGTILGRDFIYPKWGNALAKAHLDFRKGRNRYKGLSRPDKEKALARQLEDIADQSTAMLGPWQ